MKEKLYTIPLMDAFKAEDECPFCFVERQLEQHAMDFVLGAGASYMEDDVRAETDKMGFCRTHYKKMYDYGNRLGTGLILKTHFQYKTKELHEQIVKERIEGGANEKAVLRFFINCPFVCINFDFFWLNKARQLYMDF